MQSNSFSAFLNQISSDFIPVITASISKESYYPLDLSSENVELLSIDLASSSDMGAYIDKLLHNNNALVAYGGYLEKRGIYERSTHFKKEDPDTERNIHLGIDLWIEAKTEVLAVLDGKIHSFQDNINFGDYGPTIILEHTYKGETFYTLYGHLSRASLKNIYIGKQVKQAEVIAQLGDAKVNGDYAPHLHFQIIKNIGNYKGDYPGVCSKKDFHYYSENCPDPNLVLKIY